MHKKRLLLLIPNLGTGGAQKVYRQQLTLLAKNYDVMGCVFNRDGFLPQDYNANLHSLDVSGGANVISKVLFFFTRIIRLRRLKRQLSIDVCISHLEGADYINLFARNKDKVICWIHGTKTFDQNITGWLGWLRKKIFIPFTYGRCDFLVTVNSRIRKELVVDYGVPEFKVKTIYNGFDLRAINLESQQSLNKDVTDLMDVPIIITHCRLAKEKNLGALLELFKLVRDARPVRLFILGDGEQRNDLIKKSRELNLQTFDVWSGKSPDTKTPDVCFLGYQSNPYQYLSKASLYLMTSLWEGFPLALCEAMACGLPVISTDCYTGPREILDPNHHAPIPTTEIVRGEFGILLPIFDSHNFAEMKACSQEVITLLSNENLRSIYSNRALQRVSGFDHEKIFQQIVNVIEQVTSDR